MSYPKLIALANKLADATMYSVVTWKETETEGVFQISFSDNSVRIGERPSRNSYGQEEYVLSILNSEGDLVEELGDEDVAEDERARMFRALKDMYETARRQAKGVDQVLDEILQELDDQMPPF